MIEGLQIENAQKSGKVFYYPAVLTVKGVSQYRDDEISFVEISGYWSLKYEPRSYVYSSAPREAGTNPGDGKLHVGDVAKFGLNINPKSSGNSFYNNISSVMPANGETPIERAQSQGQPAPQSGGSWASEPATTSEPYVDKWDLKDIHIRKAQALNLLTEVLISGDKVNAPKIILAMGFTDAAEAIDAVANGWNSLRRGLPIEFPVAVSDMEEEVVAEDSPMVEAAVDLGSDVIEEDVESVSWD
jgi:hypothetical protein